MSKTFFQFYASIFSCDTFNTHVFNSFKQRTKTHHVNIHTIRNISKAMHFIYEKIPKKIIFKNDPWKTETSSIIRKLFLFSFLRNRMNQYVGIKIPLLEKNRKIIPIITPSAFTIQIPASCKKTLKFNILRVNKYSKKSRTFIYDWKEASRLEQFLKNINLSINKMWLNIREEFLLKMLDFVVYEKLLHYPNQYVKIGKFNSFCNTIQLNINTIDIAKIESWFGNTARYNVWNPYQKKNLF